MNKKNIRHGVAATLLEAGLLVSAPVSQTPLVKFIETILQHQIAIKASMTLSNFDHTIEITAQYSFTMPKLFYLDLLLTDL